VEWLRAQLDRDDQMAEVVKREADAVRKGDAIRADGMLASVRFVLRDITFKRRLLDEHALIHRDIGWLEEDEGERVEEGAELPVCGRCVPKHSHFATRQQVPEGPCRTVRLLAEVYADRPGYREEWRAQ
jgi:hypothetical protein